MRFSILTLLGLVAFAAVGCSDAGKPEVAHQTDLITVSAGNSKGGKAAEILLRSRAAYAKLQSYKGSIRLVDTWEYVGRSRTVTKTAKVLFSRPNKMRLEFQDSVEETVLVISDGNRVVSTDLKTEGAFETHKSLQEALSLWTGVSSWISTTLPGILLNTSWEAETTFLPSGSLLSALATKAELQRTETVDGHDCHKIVCVRDIATWTLWIDVESNLVRRINATISPEQMNVLKQYGGGGRSGRIVKKENDQTFSIDEINPSLDKEFTLPKQVSK